MYYVWPNTVYLVSTCHIYVFVHICTYVPYHIWINFISQLQHINIVVFLLIIKHMKDSVFKHKNSHKIFDPLIGLALWINEQRPSSWKLHNYSILYREGVTRKAADLPWSNFYWVGERKHKIDSVGMWDFIICQCLQPQLQQTGPILSLFVKMLEYTLY